MTPRDVAHLLTQAGIYAEGTGSDLYIDLAGQRVELLNIGAVVVSR